MKIYNISEIPDGLRVPSYEEVLLSGYTDGYEAAYDGYKCYPKMYFTIEAYENGVIPNLSNGFFYSRNGGEWEQYLGGGFSVSAGDVIQFKAETTRIYNDFQGMQFRCAAYGNVMSLLYGDNFVGRTDLPHGRQNSITSLFSNCTGLFDASELVLPATELEVYCYANMFSGCVNLTSIPKLPATTLAEGCYQGMFRGCTSLNTVPELPVMELAPMCYEIMFENCTALETAPALPATELVERCYTAMFRGCTSLVDAQELPATTLGSSCYNAMFYGCTSLVDAPDLPAEVLSDFCYYEMFMGCTSLTGAPVICATTLAENACCKGMFKGCTSLVNAPAILPATSITRGCYEEMFSGCTSLENSPVLPATILANNCYESMFSDCTNLQSAPSLPATSLYENCYNNMFRGCTSLQSAPELPATTLADYCYRGMFFDCSSLETAPELLADILVDGCYLAMFSFCSSLTYIKCLATYIDAPECTAGWVYGITGEGVFEKACVDWDNKGYGSGIPGGWTVIDNCPPLESRFNAVYNVGPNNLVKIFGDSGATAFSKVELEDGTDITSQINNGWYTASQSGQIRVFLTPANTGETEVFAYAFGKNESFIPHSGGANLYSIVIPDGYTSIGEGAFRGCNDLSEVVLPRGITTVKSNGFCCCYDLDIELPNTLTEIWWYGFAYCTSITNLTIPSGITYIDSASFLGIGVREIVVPATVTVVNSGAFSSCENLTSVTIGNNVSYVGDSAFLNCSGITEMIFERTSPPMIGSMAPLGQTEYTFPIYVPDASVDAYKEHMDWVDYASRVKGISEKP